MRRFLLLSAPLLLTALLAAPQAAHACGGEKAHACPLKAEGATVEVTELEDGVQLTLTSDDAETVERLQAHARKVAAQRGEGGCERCQGHAKAEGHGEGHAEGHGCQHHGEAHAGQ